MKKNFTIIFISIFILSFSSCLSIIKNQPTVIDQGHYYKDVPALETSNIIVDENLTITGIDETSGLFATEVKGWKMKNYPSQLQTFKLNPGTHTISVIFQSATQCDLCSSIMKGVFEANEEYKITCEIINNVVIYNILNTKTNESILIDK